MSFKKKKIFEQEGYESGFDFIKQRFDITGMIRFLVVLWCSILILVFSSTLADWWKMFAGMIGKETVKVLSTSLGQEMQKDGSWNVNILIVGVGGSAHQWGYLADSMMVASFNPQLGAVTFLSLPRDLYIQKDKQIFGKINMLLAHGYNKYQDLGSGALYLAEKVEEITGLPIPYYAIIDFQGFTTMIDQVGWVEVTLKKDFVDYQYPNDNRGYETFRLLSGTHLLSWETALKYVRSRHSTSDFSRSARQQEIMKALLVKIFSTQGALNVNNLKKLYEQYAQIVTTNVDVKEIIGMSKYVYDLKHFFSFNYTNECGYTTFRLMKPWCFLYAPLMEEFAGMSVLLPDGASVSSLSMYKYMQGFTSYVAHDQGYLVEGLKIQVQNGIDKKRKGKVNGLASNVAVKLKKYGFQIVDVDNASEGYEDTILYVHTTGDYQKTLSTLKTFLPIDQILTWNQLSGVDITLIIGGKYSDTMKGKRFSFEQ